MLGEFVDHGVERLFINRQRDQSRSRHIEQHPEIVEGRRILDFGAGSGLLAIAAAKAGAAAVAAADIDPLARAAIALNAEANGIAVALLDADLTVPPEDLPKFYHAIASGKGDFINGTRLVYPMEQQAMRFLNLLGNHFFSMVFSWLLDQRIKDTLCGTKVLSREHYNRVAANRAYFGEFDPFGDFDLLFGAARLNLKIADVPIRYRERTYGTTNIQRWRHGVLLLRMVMFAARKLKFV